MNPSQSKKFDQEVFTFKDTKDGKVFIYWNGREVKTLNSKNGRKFLTQLNDLDGQAEQLLLAKITGNFKRGNEK